jgi:hypothetical protein
MLQIDLGHRSLCEFDLIDAGGLHTGPAEDDTLQVEAITVRAPEIGDAQVQSGWGASLAENPESGQRRLQIGGPTLQRRDFIDRRLFLGASTAGQGACERMNAARMEMTVSRSLDERECSA